MEKNEIIQIALLILAGFVSSLSQFIFDKIFSAYNPDVKRIASGIKKFFNFMFSYILPILCLVLLYITYDKVDKVLIFSTAFLFSVLIFNVLFSILKNVIEILKLTNDQELFENIASAIKANYEISVGHNKVIKGMVKSQKKHSNVTEGLLDIVKKTASENKKPNH